MAVIQPGKRFTRLLNDLGIARGDIVYVHTSFKRIAYLGLTGEQLIVVLLETIGSAGTLVLPSFAWNLHRSERPWKGYAEYFVRRPPFDVRNTPANIGWIPEVFRRVAGARRSLSYCWSVCALGPLAPRLTMGQES